MRTRSYQVTSRDILTQGMHQERCAFIGGLKNLGVNEQYIAYTKWVMMERADQDGQSL